MIRFGSLRRLRPIDRWYGWGRGTPVDRVYIERFLERQAGQDDYLIGDVRGRVMEVGDDKYTRRFGNVHAGPGEPPPGAVTSVDVLQGDDSNPIATVVGDLATGEGIPEDAFDCVICTQTLPLIYDLRGAAANLYRCLRPGGVLLLTTQGISQTCRPDVHIYGDYWRLTSHSCRRLFGEVFGAENVGVNGYGNVHVAAAFLYGLCAEDLRPAALELDDPDYELIVSVRAVKPG